MLLVCTVNKEKLESQHVYLTLLTMNLNVIFGVKICVGVVSTILQISGKLYKLQHSFSLCNYVT